MATIVTRAGKGSQLTHNEVDANFTNLNTDKIELTNLSVSTASASSGGALAYNNSTGAFTFTPASVTTTTINNNADNRVITGSGSANTLEGEANFTFDGTTVGVTGTSLSDSLLLTTTEDSSTAGPVLTLKRNSSSPADSDYIGQIKFKGENDADQEVVYAKITGKISDASDTSEDGIIEFATQKAGSNNIAVRLASDELKLINDTTLDINKAPTFVAGSVPVQLTGTQPNAGGYFVHTTINTGTTRGGIGYRSQPAAQGSKKVDTHMLYFDLDDDYGLRPGGSFQGDRNIWFQANHTDDSAHIYFDGFSTNTIESFDGNNASYARTDLEIHGATTKIKASGTTALTASSSILTAGVDFDTDGNDIKMGGGTIDLEAGAITSTGGDITFNDNMTVEINSSGTDTLTVNNTSATGLGLRVNLGGNSSAQHTSGDAILTRRHTGSGFAETFKVSTINSGAKSEVTMEQLGALTNQNVVGTGTKTDQGYLEILINGATRYIPYFS